MSTLLADFPVHHAHLKPARHPELGVEINGRTAVRYMRFLRPVRLDRLELGRILYGRNIPKVPTHPAHLIVSLLDRKTNRWELVREVDLPEHPTIRGKGLSQRMTTAEMNKRLVKTLTEPPMKIPLHGLVTDHLRVECDREHPY